MNDPKQYIEGTAIVGKTVAGVVVQPDTPETVESIRIDFTDGTWTAFRGDHWHDGAGVSFHQFHTSES